MAVGAARQLLGAPLQRVAGPVRFQVTRSDSARLRARQRHRPPLALGGLVLRYQRRRAALELAAGLAVCALAADVAVQLARRYTRAAAGLGAFTARHSHSAASCCDAVPVNAQP